MADVQNIIDEDEEENNSIVQYLNLYGSIYLDDTVFNHYKELGEKYLQYKPETIILWFGEKRNENILAGAEIIYRNIIDGTKKEYKDCIGKKIKDKYTFNISPIEYLTNFKMWYSDEGIYRIYFQTNKGKEFSIGQKKGMDVKIDEFKKPQIILFFHGRCNNYLTSFSPIIIHRDKYLRILFEGYFLLKNLLKRENKRKEIIKNMEAGIYKDDDVALIRTCLLSDYPFNGIIKYCIV